MWYHLLELPELVTGTQVQRMQPSTVNAFIFIFIHKESQKQFVFSWNGHQYIDMFLSQDYVDSLSLCHDLKIAGPYELHTEHHNDVILIGWMNKKWQMFLEPLIRCMESRI